MPKILTSTIRCTEEVDPFLNEIVRRVSYAWRTYSGRMTFETVAVKADNELEAVCKALKSRNSSDVLTRDVWDYVKSHFFEWR